MTNTNPILPGFHPDPSIIRVGINYYLANSTFEWFPGVQIHHSTDLVNWELIGYPLDRVELLDLKGVPDSCGVWAPCLSYHDGTYYLVYSQVRSFDGMFKDTPNFLTTAQDIKGPWSDPIFLDASGFDGSLFHDSDGKKYYLSMLVDHREGKFFGGIIMQEYSDFQEKLVGPKRLIYEGTSLGITEGPHLYHLNGYYYLLTAEGGTEYGHAVSIARSKDIWGPYENHPENPLLTAAEHTWYNFQKVGHGDMVWTPLGECFIVFLMGRPLSERGRCPLGRETAIERIVWKNDGWPYLPHKERLPRFNLIELPEKKDRVNEPDEVDFFKRKIPLNFQSLRIPITEDWCTFREGGLRLIGRESLGSTFEQSLLARRVQDFQFHCETKFRFQPDHFQQMAGLVAYYNTGHYYYLHVTANESGRIIQLVRTKNFEYEELSSPIPLPGKEPIRLSLAWNNDKIEFFYFTYDWKSVGNIYDSTILSDDFVREGGIHYRPAFTGAFVGICCQDLTGHRKAADFEFFNYTPLL